VSAKNFELPAKGYLHWLRRPLLTHLPRTGRILEAGCGPGYVVLALRTLNYDVEGVEWAEDLVRDVQSLRPELPIRVGDVTALDVPNASYRAVISLGVAEHRREGPDPFVAEAYRVLEPGGILLISVPHFHFARRLRYRSACSKSAQTMEFYQYAFVPGEFEGILRTHGFRVVARYGYEVWDGLCEDFAFLKIIERMPALGPRIPGLVNRSGLLSNLLGHMILFVAERSRS
jgi:SAM-dependent methyltransferase